MDKFDVFVDTLDSSFSIRVGIWDTVLMIKQKIEISQAVPISKQTLLFKGKILQDHREIVRCNVLQNSRLFLSISPEEIPNHKNNQVIHQTKHSPAPSKSNSTQQIIHSHQYLPVRRRSNTSQVLQTKQSPAPSNQIDPFLNSQDWPLMVGSNNDQMLQTEKTPISLNSTDRFLGIQDSPPVASDAVADTIYGQDSSVMVRRNYKKSEKLRGIQYHLPSAMVGCNSNRKQVVRPLTSYYSVKEIIDIPDSPVKKRIKISPMKMTVMVKPIMESWSIPIEVNVDDNVEELRKELVKMQERGQINLLQERYFFIHNQKPLDEHQSFRRNLVADGDTIEIFQVYSVSDGSTTTRVPSFGH